MAYAILPIEIQPHPRLLLQGEGNLLSYEERLGEVRGSTKPVEPANMHENLLQSLGLSPEESGVYEKMLELGIAPIQKILPKSGLKRGTLYNVLRRLVERGLIVEKEGAKKATFEVAPPAALEKLMATETAKIEENKKRLSDALPQLSSLYNLAMHKPNVQFFEGLEGIKKVLDDTLENNIGKNILTFSDVAGYATYLKEWNQKYYAPKRKRLGIHEKVIIPNHPKAIEYMKGYSANDVTEILFIDHALYPFTTEINIYDGKVSFVTFSPELHVGVLVEDKAIFDTLTSIFHFTWKLGQAYCKDLQSTLRPPSAPLVARPSAPAVSEPPHTAG